MSSNTLRGVGQEGDGEGEDSSRPPPEGAETITALKDPRKIHALDASPSGFGASKIPSLETTLQGASGPSINKQEDRPMVQDVESAKLQDPEQASVQDRSGAGPRRANLAEPSVAERERPPITTHVLSPPGGPPSEGFGRQPRRLDQARARGGDDVYEDPPPTFLRRVAIGVAVAAVLSIVLMMTVRFRVLTGTTLDRTGRPATGAHRGREATRARPVDPPPPSEAPAAARARSPDPSLMGPGSDGKDQGLPSSWDPRSGGDLAGDLGSDPGRGAQPASGTRVRPAVRISTAPAPRRPAVRAVEVSRTPSVAPQALTTAPGSPPAAPPAAASPTADHTVTPVVPRQPGPEPPPSSGPLAKPNPAPAGAGAPASRGKAGYDPDSTLPLNVD